jgi:glycosyltransferase involved in cell wall biosynthesis
MNRLVRIDNPPLPPVPQLVTVCLPCWDAAATLPETLAALERQSWPDWQLVAVDDGSTDATAAILDAFAARHPERVMIVRLERNRGLSAARNTALRQGTGAWAALLDADDVWDPDHLAGLLGAAAAATAGADLVFARVRPIGAGGTTRPGPVPRRARRNLTAALFGRAFIQPSAVLLRRAALLELGGFDEDLRHCEDIDLWLRLCRAGWRFVHLPRATCGYRLRADSLSRLSLPLSRARLRVHLRHRRWARAEAGLSLHAELARTLKSLAYRIRARRPRRAARLYRIAWKLCPWQLHHALFAAVFG